MKTWIWMDLHCLHFFFQRTPPLKYEINKGENLQEVNLVSGERFHLTVLMDLPICKTIFFPCWYLLGLSFSSKFFNPHTGSSVIVDNTYSMFKKTCSLMKVCFFNYWSFARSHVRLHMQFHTVWSFYFNYISKYLAHLPIIYCQVAFFSIFPHLSIYKTNATWPIRYVFR